MFLSSNHIKKKEKEKEKIKKRKRKKKRRSDRPCGRVTCWSGQVNYLAIYYCPGHQVIV
jgi:single-stranded DNA-binding protein